MNVKDSRIKELLKKGEGPNIEFKKATNTFPQDALTTISAFANTEGGLLVLGVSDDQNREYKITGVQSPEKIIDSLFNMMNNPQRINRNVIPQDNVRTHTIFDDGQEKKVIVISIDKENYRNKPIYLKNNMNLAYYRQGSNDYQCPVEMIKAMSRDASNESYDSIKIADYSIDDFDSDTIKRYRNMFTKVLPDHPFNQLDDENFLIKIKALARDRTSFQTVPTVAGLLVFGKHVSIREYLPRYHIEYVVKSMDGENTTYKDRVIYDGTWGEDNLLTFFSYVIEKIYLTLNETSEIQRDSITRQTASKLRIAVREAFVNTMIHCDYKSGIETIITRYPDKLVFRNGGSLRISIEDFYKGGHSDPRNPYIENIFRFIGLCERAGTGIPKIMDAAKEYKLRLPNLNADMSCVEFTLWDTSILSNLQLEHPLEEQIINLVLAERRITVTKLSELAKVHRNTASKYLRSLLEREILSRHKIGREYYYTLAQVDNEEYWKYFFLESIYNILDGLKRG